MCACAHRARPPQSSSRSPSGAARSRAGARPALPRARRSRSPAAASARRRARRRCRPQAAPGARHARRSRLPRPRPPRAAAARPASRPEQQQQPRPAVSAAKWRILQTARRPYYCTEPIMKRRQACPGPAQARSTAAAGLALTRNPVECRLPEALLSELVSSTSSMSKRKSMCTTLPCRSSSCNPRRQLQPRAQVRALWHRAPHALGLRPARVLRPRVGRPPESL